MIINPPPPEKPPIEASPVARKVECDRLKDAECAARKAAEDARRIRAEIEHRDNQWRDLVAALASADKQVEIARWQIEEAEQDYARTVAGIDSLAGNADNHRALWAYARENVSPERIGLEIVREAVSKVPARREAALTALREFAKTHSIPKELWPAALATE